jgi:hypothetical protein
VRQEDEIPNGVGEAVNGPTMMRVFAHESVHARRPASRSPPPARGRESCAATTPFCDTVTYAPPIS